MPMTLSGDGSITGLAAGGLPDATVTTAEIADAAVTAAKMSGAQSGSAPIYGARAWVNFNGTGTVAIRASGNVSSITDNASADYTINFTTAMPDANYAIGQIAEDHSNTEGYAFVGMPLNGTRTTTAFRIRTTRLNVGNVDCPTICLSIFR